ncbi:MAG TPA: PilZ domain-containing protein [Croceibacterium sp.]
MKARCRSQSGAKLELAVLDLSPIGCMLHRHAWSAQPGERILVQLEGLSFQPARVSWVEGELAGVEFEQLLHEAVLERLKASLARAAQAA